VALYVIIPSDLALELHEPLRRHFRHEPSVFVVVERRSASQASPAGARRRVEDGEGPVPSRRVVLPSAAPESLPPEAHPHANRLRYFVTMDPAAPGVADIESLRLVARFQRGDATAFDGLYRRHFASIYNYARMATSSADHAEDVAQQVFFRAARALPRYRIQPEVPFRAWLLTITRREVLRVLQGHAAVEPRDPEEIAAMTEVTGEDRWAAKWLTLPGIAELVDELPRRQQQVLMLRYALGMSVRETASVIGASEDAVNSLRRRALETLRGGVEELGYAPTRTDRNPMMMWIRRKLSPVLTRRGSAPWRGHDPNLRPDRRFFRPVGF
jgi:RNA polymerase sigma-70 factor (ECF subfamily)